MPTYDAPPILVEYFRLLAPCFHQGGHTADAKFYDDSPPLLTVGLLNVRCATARRPYRRHDELLFSSMISQRDITSLFRR